MKKIKNLRNINPRSKVNIMIQQCSAIAVLKVCEKLRKIPKGNLIRLKWFSCRILSTLSTSYVCFVYQCYLQLYILVLYIWVCC